MNAEAIIDAEGAVIVADANEFAAWLADKPKPGARCQYYRGLLARDRAPPHPTPNTRELSLLAGIVWRQYEAGKVTLVQKRMGDGDYIYFAEAISPRHMQPA